MNTLYTSTWERGRKDAVDAFFMATPVFFVMEEKGHRRAQAGGRKIDQPIEMDENDTVGFIKKGGTVSTSDTDPLTQLYYSWKYLAGGITRFKADDLMNRGDRRIINMVDTKLKNLKKSMKTVMETALLGSGAGDDINGFGNLITTDGTTSDIGGIGTTEFARWANQYKASSGASDAGYLETDLDELYMNCSDSLTDPPDLFITDEATWRYYKQACRTYFMTEEKLDLGGFKNVVYEGGALVPSKQCTAGYWYMINTDYFYVVYDPSADFEMTQWKEPVNQVGDQYAQILWVGNLIVSRRDRHGVLYGIT